MTVKLIGAALVILGCAGTGFRIAACYLKEERTLRQLIYLLDYMECELQYRMTPLPTLCRQAATQGRGVLRELFISFASELENQIHPDVWQCMRSALAKTKDIPKNTGEGLRLLGKSLGRFDLQGQLNGLEAVRQECRCKLTELSNNRDARIHSYKTLGLCAGAAMVILFL